MHTYKLTAGARTLAVAIGTFAFVRRRPGRRATRTPTTRRSRPAKAAYDAAKTKCDALKDNAKDICVAEAKAARTRTEVDAEAVYKGTPKAREHAIHEIAEADYKVAKERCDDKAGNDKDVCVKVAKAAMTKAKADAKAARVSTDAKVDASKDKREADYKVAAEKCDAMSGDAKSACVKAAKAKYGM
jgi:hypothetical protein